MDVCTVMQILHFVRDVMRAYRLVLFGYFWLSCVLMVSCSMSGTGDETIAGDVTFIAVANTGRVTDDGLAYRKIAEFISPEFADFAVDLGNRLPPFVSSEALEPLLDAVDDEMAAFPVPVYPVAGRDDVFDYFSDLSYNSRYGAMWYDFEKDGFRFIVINTEDGGYDIRFGDKLHISEEQLTWLTGVTSECSARSQPVIVFMGRPVWMDDAGLWSGTLVPLLKTCDVRLILTAYDGGLFDWGRVNGIRAVSTGCAGPVGDASPGLFPHMLGVKLMGDKLEFTVIRPDGSVSTGIPVTEKTVKDIEKFATLIRPELIETGESWNVAASRAVELKNPFDVPISGSLSFTTFNSTSWTIEPPGFNFNLSPGEGSTYHYTMKAISPDIAPLPEYALNISLGDVSAFTEQGTVVRTIPDPRIDEVVPLDIVVPDVVPGAFDGTMIRVPIEVDGYDVSGRLSVYRNDIGDYPVCVHISPLREFRDGMNLFEWDGRDMSGNPVIADSLMYYVTAYNRKAPPTWVAEGPPDPGGSFIIERTHTGLRAVTHTDSDIVTYRLHGSIDRPKAETLYPLADYLDGKTITGIAMSDDGRLFCSTDAGIMAFSVRRNDLYLIESFGEKGYLRLEDSRGRITGKPVFNNGRLCVSIGGTADKSGEIYILDAQTGETLTVIPLDPYYEPSTEPSVVSANWDGLTVAHPDFAAVLRFSYNGDCIWINEPGDRGGDLDSDGRSFTYGVGIDRFGFQYVNAPGTSARCAVIGPGGRALYRVILVILPGLRVGSAVPWIEGKSTDGLYFVTRGGDRDYVFHVPYTIRRGIIRNQSLAIESE